VRISPLADWRTGSSHYEKCVARGGAWVGGLMMPLAFHTKYWDNKLYQ